MELNLKLLDKIDNLVKLTDNYDSGFKKIFELNTNDKLDEKNIEILYSMTKNFILIRKIHGEIILMVNKLINSVNIEDINNLDKKQEKKLNKINTKTKDKDKDKDKNENDDNDDDDNNLTKSLYEISTFSTLLNNINDLVNNIDYEYKKIAIKYPRFINKSKITLIIISADNDEDHAKYIKLIEELKSDYPEHKYKLIKCGNKKTDLNKCENELKEYGIKIKSVKSLPILYIVNNSNVTEVPISKIGGGIEQIKNLIE